MWLVGVVSRRWVCLVGGIYGYGYNVYVGVVSGCCCKEVYRYPHNNNNNNNTHIAAIAPLPLTTHPR